MRTVLRSTMCIAWLGFVAHSAFAELPIPEHPRWQPVRDNVYLQEVGSRVKTSQPLLSAAVHNNTLYVGTVDGVRRLDGQELVSAGGPAGTTKRLRTLGQSMLAFSSDGLWRFSQGQWKKLSNDAFVDGCVHLGQIVVASSSHLYRLDGDTLTALHERPSAAPILGVDSYAETLYVRHTAQVTLFANGQFDPDNVQDWGHLPLGSTTRDMLAMGGRLAVPTDRGLAELHGMSWHVITGKDGLCYEDTTCIAPGFADDYWVGTTRGAIRAVNGEFQYFGYQRWIPNDKVNAIACGDRVAYIATDGGLGIIAYEPFTLQKKAEYYERYIEEWGMRRVGFVCSLTWDKERKEWVRFISDNDGGWAGHLLNGFAFKYAVTKDPVARENAVDVFRTLKWCETITPIDGFPARAIATVGEPSVLAATGSAGLPSEWNPTPDNVWLWKGDTSSDEVDSHLQSTVIFYELAAQGKEKDAAREHLQRIVGHIVDNGWVLRDMDGKPTRWARWDPEYLQRPYGIDARGLNGLEALSMVTAAYAVTGDEKFKKGHQQLLDWGYQNDVLRQKLVFPVVTHFDDRLAFLAFLPVLTYETDPGLRSIYRRSLERSWEVKRHENMVWFDFVYGALTGNEVDGARCVRNLQAWPLDCIEYPYTNSHRADLQNVDRYAGYIRDWKCMTARDIGVTRWDTDYMLLDRPGDAPTSVQDPAAFIDAYWMGRYYGMILPPETNDTSLLTVEKRGLQLGAKPYDGPPRPDLGF